MKRLLVLFVLIVCMTGCRALRTAAVISTAEPTIKVIPPPKYLGLILPEPGGVYSVAEYEALASSLGGWGATAPCICLGVRPFWLMERGDFPTPEEWLAQIYMIVDDRIITEYHVLLMNDSLGSEGLDPETGEVLFKAPDGSPYEICYAASLGAGRHTATFVAEKTSGEEVSYTWQFIITDGEE